MKKIFLTAIILLSVSIGFAQAPKFDTVIVKTKIYCDHCSQCETCQSHIEKELAFEKGIKLSTVNPQNQTITVVYNSKKITVEKIKQAIAKTGYDADDVKAGSSDVGKLDGCCRKN